LIQFWNFDNGDAILRLVDKTVNQDEQSNEVFAEGNVKGGIRIENSDGKAMLLTEGVETAEFIPGLNTAVEKPKLVEAESVAAKDWIGAVAQSLQPTHIMTFFFGKLGWITQQDWHTSNSKLGISIAAVLSYVLSSWA
jgi:hypothetical protein